jgi:hypothetical protein
MKIRSLAAPALLLFASAGCGPSKPAQSADDVPPPETTNTGDAEKVDTSKGPAPGASDDTGGGKGNNSCSGFEMDLMAALNLSACEVENAKGDTKPKDVKDTLVVTVNADSARVAAGGHADLVVTFKNKGAVPIALDFIVDPTPRFSVETYNAKTNKRVDMPPGSEPKLPAGVDPRVPGETKTARITLAANGVGTVHVPWDAVKTRWAPEKLKGTPPEMGYPRAPNGSLPKGKYNLRVVTPLTNVFEGIDHEISAPRTVIEIQ